MWPEPLQEQCATKLQVIGTKRSQPRCEVQGTKQAIYDSVRMSRAWTLQEGLCSRRLINFSENESVLRTRCDEVSRTYETRGGEDGRLVRAITWYRRLTYDSGLLRSASEFLAYGARLFKKAFDA